jgi:hypothetical protein
MGKLPSEPSGASWASEVPQTSPLIPQLLVKAE